MTRRLELDLPDEEYAALDIAASAAGKTIADWARTTLRVACSKRQGGTAIDVAAARHKETVTFAADDIRRMLADPEFDPDTPKKP